MPSEERTLREADRVRRHTNELINHGIDQATERAVVKTLDLGPRAIQRRLEELDREWDIERVLEANAASIGFIGVVLGTFVSLYWLILPAIVTLSLLQHAIQGWCPPLALLRRMGKRTRREIDRERYALKALRGDFDELRGDEQRALEAATT